MQMSYFLICSNFWPLWTEAYNPNQKEKFASAGVEYIQNQQLVEKYPGGIPATELETGQQWDFPNCWPPQEYMVVMGLEKTGIPEAKELAFQLAAKRIRGSYLNFTSLGHMFEKVINIGVHLIHKMKVSFFLIT